MNLYLTRHGQDEDNANGLLNGHRDMPLTKVGIEQSKKLAQQIKKLDIKFDKIYTSPLKRAIQTAEIINQTLENEVPVILDDLIERNFGCMTGKPIKNIQELCKSDILRTAFTIYFLAEEGAETFPQLFKRAKKVLSQLTDNLLEQNILLVTHGDLGKMIYAAYHDRDWKEVLKQFHFHNTQFLILK